MSLKIEDVMVEDVVTIDADATVKQAVDVMNKYEIGCLIVLKQEKAIGIITERDMLNRVLAESRDPKKTLVAAVMTAPLIIAEPDMELEEAVRLMFKMKVKKLPVIQRGELVGLVTLTDIARFQPQIIKLAKKLFTQTQPPKRMQKVIGYYIS
jgi:CBS domain-containing protein